MASNILNSTTDRRFAEEYLKDKEAADKHFYENKDRYANEWLAIQIADFASPEIEFIDTEKEQNKLYLDEQRRIIDEALDNTGQNLRVMGDSVEKLGRDVAIEQYIEDQLIVIKKLDSERERAIDAFNKVQDDLKKLAYDYAKKADLHKSNLQQAQIERQKLNTLENSSAEAAKLISDHYRNGANGKIYDPTQKSSESNIRFRDEMHAYRNNQKDQSLHVEINGKSIGRIDYVEYEGKPSINIIEVSDEFKRKGYATKLLQELQLRYPNTEIDFGMLTNDGGSLYKNIKFVEIADPEVANAKAKMADLEKRIASVKEQADLISANSNLSQEEIKKLSSYDEQWNDLRYEYDALEEQYRDRSPVKKIVDTSSYNNIPSVTPIKSTWGYGSAAQSALDADRGLTRRVEMLGALAENETDPLIRERFQVQAILENADYRSAQNIRIANMYGSNNGHFIEKSKEYSEQADAMAVKAALIDKLLEERGLAIDFSNNELEVKEIQPHETMASQGLDSKIRAYESYRNQEIELNKIELRTSLSAYEMNSAKASFNDATLEAEKLKSIAETVTFNLTEERNKLNRLESARNANSADYRVTAKRGDLIIEKLGVTNPVLNESVNKLNDGKLTAFELIDEMRKNFKANLDRGYKFTEYEDNEFNKTVNTIASSLVIDRSEYVYELLRVEKTGYLSPSETSLFNKFINKNIDENALRDGLKAVQDDRNEYINQVRAVESSDETAFNKRHAIRKLEGDYNNKGIFNKKQLKAIHNVMESSINDQLTISNDDINTLAGTAGGHGHIGSIFVKNFMNVIEIQANMSAGHSSARKLDNARNAGLPEYVIANKKEHENTQSESMGMSV